MSFKETEDIFSKDKKERFFFFLKLFENEEDIPSVLQEEGGYLLQGQEGELLLLLEVVREKEIFFSASFVDATEIFFSVSFEDAKEISSRTQRRSPSSP